MNGTGNKWDNIDPERQMSLQICVFSLSYLEKLERGYWWGRENKDVKQILGKMKGRGLKLLKKSSKRRDRWKEEAEQMEEG